jgi:hypothetical protein
MTVGSSWILPSTNFFSKKSLFIHASGPFGDPLFSPITLARAQEALLPCATEKTGARPTEPLLLVVELQGLLHERFLKIARAALVSKRLGRRLVFVWDPRPVKGLSLADLLEGPYFALTPQEILAVMPHSTLPVIVIPIPLASRGHEADIHLRVTSLEALDPALVDEVEFNTAVGLLRPTFFIKEASYKLMVGRTYRGLVIDRDNQCGELHLLAALKVCSSIFS